MTLFAIIIILLALVVAWIYIAITGRSIKKQWWPLVLAVFIGWNVFVPLVIRSATYHGRVVDQETGAPLAGAAVAVIWYASPIIYMDRTRRFMRAAETVTAADGTFLLWTWPGISFNPFMYVRTPPDTIIYKADYAPLSYATAYDRGYETSTELADALQDGVVMKLPKLRTLEEARRFVPKSSLSMIDVPDQSVVHLVREIHAHAENVLGKIPENRDRIRRPSFPIKESGP